MSDKSVKKVLDWPNQSTQDKPPTMGQWTATTGPGEKFEATQRCPVHGERYVWHTQEQLDEDIAAVEKRIAEHQSAYGEQDSQPLDPTSQQNMTPFGQGQFIPTATYGPGKGEAVTKCPECGSVNLAYDASIDETSCDSCGWISGMGKGEQGAITPEIEADLSIDVDCPSCGKTSYVGPLGAEEILKDHQWVCPYCGHVEVIDDEEALDFFLFDVGEEENGFEPMEEQGGPLGDPREREKELHKPGVEPGAELSPEAQKIAGKDPASMAQKQKEKPKLEVDTDQKITVLGKTGSGKTNLIKVLMADILPDYNFVLLDSIGNFAEFEGKPNIEYHQVNPADEEEIDKIIYSALERGDCMVVIDEVDRYNSKKGTMLNELVNLGRNYGVGGIFAARRTADVDKDILANSPYIFVFQHILPQDLSVLIDWFAQPEDVFRDLQEFEAILFKDGEQIWVGKVPEMPTTKPTVKPQPPKKPKGKEPPEKGKEPTPPTGEGREPTVGEGGEKEPPAEKEPAPEKKPPELTPADEGERVASEKSEARYADEAPFVCEVEGQRFKYESDFEEHMVREHAY